MVNDERSVPRLEPLTAPEWGDEEYAAFGAMLGLPGDRVPRAGSGHRYDPLNFTVVGLLAHHPELAKAYFAFSAYQLQRSSLPVRWRELAILRVAHRRRSPYEWGQHVKIALEGGITASEIEALGRGNEGFDGVDRLVLEAADELLTDGRLSDGTWAGLNVDLDTHQVTDLIFVVGAYAMLAMAFETWQVQPDPWMSPLPDAS